jgi:hypothetical protein
MKHFLGELTFPVAQAAHANVESACVLTRLELERCRLPKSARFVARMILETTSHMRYFAARTIVNSALESKIVGDAVTIEPVQGLCTCHNLCTQVGKWGTLALFATAFPAFSVA